MKHWIISITVLCFLFVNNRLCFAQTTSYKYLVNELVKQRAVFPDPFDELVQTKYHYIALYGEESVRYSDDRPFGLGAMVMVYASPDSVRRSIWLSRIISDSTLSKYFLCDGDYTEMVDLNDKIATLKKDITLCEKNEALSLDKNIMQKQLEEYVQRRDAKASKIRNNIGVTYKDSFFFRVKYETPDDYKELSLKYLQDFFPDCQWDFLGYRFSNYSLVADHLVAVKRKAIPSITFEWYCVKDGVCIGTPVSIGIDPRSETVCSVSFDAESLEMRVDRSILPVLDENQLMESGRIQYLLKCKSNVRAILWRYFENDQELDGYVNENWDEIAMKFYKGQGEHLRIRYITEKKNASIGSLKADSNERSPLLAQFNEKDCLYDRTQLRYEYSVLVENYGLARKDWYFSFDAQTGDFLEFSDNNFYNCLMKGTPYINEKYNNSTILHRSSMNIIEKLGFSETKRERKKTVRMKRSTK